MQVYNTRARNPGFGGGMFGNQQFGYNPFGGNQFNKFGQPIKASASAAAGALITKNDVEGVSMFKLAIRGGQQGLAYLMLDNGYDLMHAM